MEKNMEVILLQDVKSLGKKGEIVKVSDGYARNLILPKKLGVEANAKNRQELEQQKEAERQRLQAILEEAQALGAKLKDLTVKIRIKVGENGRVFGSITTKEIAAGLKEQHGYEIDKKKMVLADAIKNVGTYEVAVKLHPQVTVNIKAVVEGE